MLASGTWAIATSAARRVGPLHRLAVIGNRRRLSAVLLCILFFFFDDFGVLVVLVGHD